MLLLQSVSALCRCLVTDGKMRVIRLQVVEGRNARDQTAFCAFHSFLVEAQTNADYIHATHV